MKDEFSRLARDKKEGAALTSCTAAEVNVWRVVLCGWRIIVSVDRAETTHRMRFSTAPTSAVRGGQLGADVRFSSRVKDGLLKQFRDIE